MRGGADPFDHHLKRTRMEIFMDDWTARLATPAVLVAIVRGVALWIAAQLAGPARRLHAVVDEPPFLWLFEALTLLGVVMGILILSTQRRADQLAELREQMTLELASVTERKVAKVIEPIERASTRQPFAQEQGPTTKPGRCPSARVPEKC